MMLANKTIVITGVSSGIGADVARLARFHGARVIGIDRNEPSMTLDGFVQVDLGSPASIDAALAALPDKIDALCNIAGVPGTAEAELVGRVNYLGLRLLIINHLWPVIISLGGSLLLVENFARQSCSLTR